MTILLLDHSAELGGGELSLFDYVRSTTKDVRVVVFEQGPFVDLLTESGVVVDVLSTGAVLGIRRNSGIAKALLIAPSLTRLVLTLAQSMRRASIVYANSQKALVVAALANAIVRRPLIWHLHDIMTAEHFSGTMRRIAIGLSNRLATHVIANSQATKESYRAAGGMLPVTVVHNGIDSAPFSEIDSVAARVTLMQEAKISTDAPIIALFGRLSAWKGQDVAINAIATVPGAHLVLIGAGLFGDTAFEATLRRQVCARGLEDRVHFLGFRHDIPRLMTAVDIVVHASTAPEPFGRVITEAMMAGTPVIATAAGGALEIVKDGVTGILCAPGDACALGTAIRRLIADPASATAMAQAARTIAQTQFSLAGAVQRTDKIIDDMITAKTH